MMVGRGVWPARALAGLLAITLLAPGVAEARAGLGGSFGSRGSRSEFAPAPTRLTPSAAAPLYTPPPSMPAYAPRSHPFMIGLMAGLAGAALGRMLFGSHIFSGVFGFLVEIVLIAFVVRALLGWLARRQIRGGSAAPSGSIPIQLSAADQAQFGRVLVAIQAAWSERDPLRMRALTTPDMLNRFESQLAELTRAGRRNTVTDVRLLQGNVSEAWAEGAREYATVAMRYAMHDVTYDDQGRVVDGSMVETVTVTELWTFVRAQGGVWVLSAIQQPG